MIDVEEGVKKIRQALKDHGFTPRDADGSDFQFGSDPGLRFKVNCVYGEVTVTVWKYARQAKEPIRILSDAQVIEAKYQIDSLINEFFTKRSRDMEDYG